MTSHQHDTAHPRSAGIRDYGIIGDGRSAALISRHGAVDWLCLPDFNSPPVFAALLDPGRGGSFSIIPDEILDISRRYLPDAALLLLPALGYLSPDDPRMLGLWEKIRRDLDQGGLIKRYSPGFAGQHAQEGAFMICSFWAADYLARLDRLDEAYQRFDRAMSYGNDLLLFSEEANPHSGAMLGNFPQAFSHTGLINAAVALARAERRRRGQEPQIHPRIATEYDGPAVHRPIEPPGFLGLNYGTGTPFVTLIGQAIYGIMLGIGYPA